MDDGEFQWDDVKAALNFAKHKVRFETARRVFDDPCSFEWEDRNPDATAPRFNVLGMTDGRLIVVTFTFRDDAIRIISARLADPFERRIYHEAKS